MKIKGFDQNLCCRGFQFEVGKTYDTGAKQLRLCSNTVFHYCNCIDQVNNYYPYENNNRFCEIEVLGEEITDGKKCGSNRIRIVREIVGEELDRLFGRINGNTGLFNTGNQNTGNQNAGNWNTGYRNTGNQNTGHWNTGHWNTGDLNTGHWNTGDRNIGNWNAGNYNIGHRNTGNCNKGNWNSGMFNSCNHSSGIFCSKPETIRIFNVDSGMTADEFYDSKYYEALTSSDFHLTEWVEYREDEKDSEEKKAVGGFLRRRTYKEACALWWEGMSSENRAIILSMPNFNPEIFYDITGIQVESKEENA